MSWQWSVDGWRHRPWWKVAINAVLRALQPWPRKLVIYTRCEGSPEEPEDPERPPVVLGYGLGLVRHRPDGGIYGRAAQIFGWRAR